MPPERQHRATPRYAVVQFDSNCGRREVRRIIRAFPDAVEAQLFAVENGHLDYLVVPVPVALTPPPADSSRPAHPWRRRGRG